MGRGKRRGTVVALAALVTAFVLHDVAAAPRDAFGARAALLAIDSYRSHVSPRLSGVIRCRFVPTCSAYGRESIRMHGLAIGGVRTLRRIARCGPWTPMGTVDPP